MDLLVRASRNDHTVIDHFLAPTSAGPLAMPRQPIGVVVADAAVALERPQLHRLTRDAGVPYVVDPMTPLFQSEQEVSDNWATLPFAQPQALAREDVGDFVLQEMVERVIEFERERGATHLVPPYFYSDKRGDAWWQTNLRALRFTAQYLSRENVNLPVIPVLAASLSEYGPAESWSRIDTFLAATRELNTEAVALSWSWSNVPKSKDAKLSLLLGATEHASRQANVIGWRSGTFGLAMSAVGAVGYETGIGTREHLHYVELATSKKPRDTPSTSTPHGQAFVYLGALGRTVTRRAGAALLTDPVLSGSLVCDPGNACCPNGADSMVHAWREHTIRERRRELNQLEAMPSMSWRLHEIERRAARAATLATTANEILAQAGERTRVPTDSLSSLSRVAATFREQSGLSVA